MNFNKYKDNSPLTHELFRQDAMQALGLDEKYSLHDWMFNLAWENGHVYGYEEVFTQLQDLKAMLVKEKNETNGSFN